MNTKYVPTQIFTGATGPEFEFYTLAVFWIAFRRDSQAWTVEAIANP